MRVIAALLFMILAAGVSATLVADDLTRTIQKDLTRGMQKDLTRGMQKDLTRGMQKDLIALGYDPGNAAAPQAEGGMTAAQDLGLTADEVEECCNPR